MRQVDIVLEASFDGWDYFHVRNNIGPGTNTAKTMAPLQVAGQSPDERMELDVDYLGAMGSFAPQEVSDPDLAEGFGDLTMHNVP